MPVAPDALANWANAITVGRLLLSPLMFLVIPEDDKGSWVAFGLWFVLCVSDLIDGYLARRHGTTSSGAFLDPLADKVLVLGAMFTLVARDVFPLLPVAIIAAREFIISIYRTVASSKGVSVRRCTSPVSSPPGCNHSGSFVSWCMSMRCAIVRSSPMAGSARWRFKRVSAVSRKKTPTPTNTTSLMPDSNAAMKVKSVSGSAGVTSSG